MVRLGEFDGDDVGVVMLEAGEVGVGAAVQLATSGVNVSASRAIHVRFLTMGCFSFTYQK